MTSRAQPVCIGLSGFPAADADVIYASRKKDSVYVQVYLYTNLYLYNNLKRNFCNINQFGYI